jgi:hypothetical protein
MSQIIKHPFEPEKLYTLLETNCVHCEKYYSLNKAAYKKGIFNETIPAFIELCKNYYYESKKNKYLNKKLTYNSFITVIRQLCNYLNIPYSNKIKYMNSNYEIVYFIYYNKNNEV